MLRKNGWAALAALTLGLTACGGPSSYTLRDDLCDVLDYQEFTKLFGPMRDLGGDEATSARMSCYRQGESASGVVSATVEVFKYGSAEQAKETFARFGKEKSDLDVELNTGVDDARYYKNNYRILVLDSDLFLRVEVRPSAQVGSIFTSQIPRLAVGLTDQALERLREKS